MATKITHTSSVFLCIFFITAQLLIPTSSAAAGGAKLGGRKEVKNVKTNKEIQELGRFCVEEYNRKMVEQGNGSRSKLLVFSEVVEAETQVVSGIKYYLRISAAPRGDGVGRTFEAVVVVKPWMRSKELVNFDPSPRAY